MHKIICLLIVLLPAIGFAYDKPAEIKDKIMAEKSYGEGTLHFMLLHVYDTSLWTDAKTFSYEQPFALSITYRMNFSKEELTERSLEEIKHAHHLPDETLAKYKKIFLEIYPNVKKGDRITAVYNSTKQVEIFYNGALYGTVADKAFAAPFFDIWLGEKTSELALRNKLLGGK
jgi:hypothetical protein